MQTVPAGTIVVVDDDSASLGGIRDFLSELGYRVHGFSSGRDALDFLRMRRSDILITDLMMPEMDGIALLKKAKEIDPLLLCIFVTGHATVRTAVESMKEGAFDYITKPVDWKIVRPVLRRALEVRRLMQSEEHLRISRDQSRKFARRLTEMQERERQRIAQELHDGIGQNLAALGLTLSSLMSPSADVSPGHVRGRLDDAIGILSDMKETIRRLVADIHPPVLDDFGLLAAMQSHGDSFSRRTGLRVRVEGDENMPRLPEFAEVTLYRIFQEALTNVARHAGARNVSVQLKQQDKRVFLEIADDGKGFDTALLRSDSSTGGWGLMNMRERALAIGATLEIDSATGRGTRISVTMGKEKPTIR